MFAKIGGAAETPPANVCDGIGDPLPYEYAPQAPLDLGLSHEGIPGIWFDIGDLLLVGVLDEVRRPRYVNLEQPSLPTPDDILAFCSAILKRYEPASLTPVASDNRLVFEARSRSGDLPASFSGTLEGVAVEQEDDTVVIEPVAPPTDPETKKFISTHDIIMNMPTVIMSNQGRQC